MRRILPAHLAAFITATFLLGGCTSQNQGDTVPSALDFEPSSTTQPEAEIVALNSCNAIADFTQDLSGANGFLDESGMLSWIIGLKNRFEQDAEHELTGRFDEIRLAWVDLVDIINPPDDWDYRDFRPFESHEKIQELVGKINYVSDFCNTQLPGISLETSGIALDHFFEFGYWYFEENENSLGEVEAGAYSVGLDEIGQRGVFALYCWPSRESALIQVITVDKNFEYQMYLDDGGLGGIRVRLDDGPIETWTGDFKNGLFYVTDNRFERLKQLDGKRELAFQAIADSSLLDFQLQTSGATNVLNRFRELGCLGS